MNPAVSLFVSALMSTEYERNCTVYVSADKTTLMSIDDIRRGLPSKNDNDKANALEHLLLHIMAGTNMNQLMMQVVQHCLHTNNKHIKRLMQLFWEVIDKLNPDGNPKEELLLIWLVICMSL